SLTWSPSTDDGSVLGYEVHRSKGDPTDLSAATTVGAVTSTSFNEPAPSGSWNYVVVAVDSAGHRSAASPPVSSTPSGLSPPAAPVVSAAASGTQVNLAWSAGTGDLPIAGYDVYRSNQSGFVADPSNRIGTTVATTYADSAVPNGTWYYEVVAFDT